MVNPVREPPDDGHEKDMHAAQVGKKEGAAPFVRNKRRQSAVDDPVAHRQLRGGRGGGGIRGGVMMNTRARINT